jgi:hypothetical protein
MMREGIRGPKNGWPMPRIKEKALKAELAKHGFESVAVKRELPAGRVEVETNKLHPVHVEGGESI